MAVSGIRYLVRSGKISGGAVRHSGKYTNYLFLAEAGCLYENNYRGFIFQ